MISLVLPRIKVKMIWKETKSLQASQNEIECVDEDA
jgi:hypothetical protein